MNPIFSLRQSSDKFDRLCVCIEAIETIAVAFSGGVDSAFLLYVASQLKGDQVVAITMKSPYIANWEVEEADAFTQSYGILHHHITAGIPDAVKTNPVDRCYLCKTVIFSTIQETAKKLGYQTVVDGSNADDTKDYRPGMRALRELNVQSPLLESGVTKAEIREWSKVLGLPTWDKPAYACLLTRLPYDVPIVMEDLRMIEKAESYLIQSGIRAVRVRKQGNLARIEVTDAYMSTFFDVEKMHLIAEVLKGFGFEQVTLDLSGYQMGSFNKGVIVDENGSN